MTDYLDLNLTTDAVSLYEESVDAIQNLADPGWTPSPIEEWILLSAARMGVEITVLAGQVPLQIFTYFGESVLRIDPIVATEATGSVTFTLTDTDGHTIERGTQIAIDDTTFTTDTELVIAPGFQQGTVTVTAAEVGAAASGLVGDDVALISPTYVFVDSVALDDPTSGGIDAEEPSDYADRLTDELPTLSPKAILIEDFEALARRNPVVGRAMAIDNYDPGPPIDDAAAGHVTVAVHDLTGQPLGASPKSDIENDLEDNRVLNLVVHVIDPTYTEVDINFEAVSYPGTDPATVEADGIAAITAFLDNTTWGRPRNGDATDWVDEQILKRNDLMGVLYTVDGIRHVTVLTLALGGGSLGTSDITLDGPAALPTVGTITGTVT